MNATPECRPSPQPNGPTAATARRSPARLEPGFALGMNQTPPRRRRRSDLSLTVTGLEPMPLELPPWERRLIEQALVELLDEMKAPEVDDAATR